MSGTVIAFLGTFLGTKHAFQPQSTCNLVRPKAIPERTAAIHGAPQPATPPRYAASPPPPRSWPYASNRVLVRSTASSRTHSKAAQSSGFSKICHVRIGAVENMIIQRAISRSFWSSYSNELSRPRQLGAIPFCSESLPRFRGVDGRS